MDAFLPFMPTDTDLQDPLASEYMRNAGHLATADFQANGTSRGASGSHWTDKEVNAVRAIPLINIDPKRIVPERFFPGDNNEVFIFLRNALRAASYDDIRQYNSGKFAQNRYQQLFDSLSNLSTTKGSEDAIIKQHRRCGSSSSELSSSSYEESPEPASTLALIEFLKTTMLNMGDYKLLGMVPQNSDMFLKSALNPIRFVWRMAGVPFEATNDGGIFVNFRGPYSHSDRYSKVPVVSMECKPRHAGGIKRGSGEAEAFIPSIFAQEVAELIGGMVAQRRMPMKHPDQETFVLSMHGTLFYISTAYFSPDYIHYIEANHPANTDNADVANLFLWVRRSVQFDLKIVTQRIEALKFVWALITYIASGEAKVNIVLSALNAPRD